MYFEQLFFLILADFSQATNFDYPLRHHSAIFGFDPHFLVGVATQQGSGHFVLLWYCWNLFGNMPVNVNPALRVS